MRVLPKTKAAKIRMSVLLCILFGSTYCFIMEPFFYTFQYQPQLGDVVVQSLPRGELTELIEGATKSNYSHVGIVVKKEGEFLINEAIVNVHDTPIFNWIRRGRRNKFAVYRLKPEYQVHIFKTIAELEKYQGLYYDFSYDFDDVYIYCSELIFKAFKDASGLEMGEIKRLGQLNWQPYKKTILKMENGRLPLDRTMITPIDLVKSEYLEKVYDNGM